jgi:hypothetical protein
LQGRLASHFLFSDEGGETDSSPMIVILVFLGVLAVHLFLLAFRVSGGKGPVPEACVLVGKCTIRLVPCSGPDARPILRAPDTTEIERHPVVTSATAREVASVTI